VGRVRYLVLAADSGCGEGEYWVLYVSDDYKTAIVGDPSRKYLWLLSRTPTVNGVVREELLSKARQQGYDTTRLIWRASDRRWRRLRKTTTSNVGASLLAKRVSVTKMLLIHRSRAGSLHFVCVSLKVRAEPG
jgi:hypothetical protein